MEHRDFSAVKLRYGTAVVKMSHFTLSGCIDCTAARGKCTVNHG